MKSALIRQVIAQITGRPVSMFAADIREASGLLSDRIGGKSLLVIGGAGTIGHAFIKAALPHNPRRLYVVDLNENGLAELMRDLRSTPGLHLPADIKTYPISFGSPVFDKILRREGPFEIVANFAALKHVRSGKDAYALEAMFVNNFLLNYRLMDGLAQSPLEHFFCISTDKATNPANAMGATKKLMEDVIFAYQDQIKVSSARFANVAFSNGSLLESFIHRYEKHQPLVCPSGVRRFFISPEEAGQLCLLACVVGQSGETFFPKLTADDLIPITQTLEAFLSVLNVTPHYVADESAARAAAAQLSSATEHKAYPVLITETDTAGEKPFEQFYTEQDLVISDRFEAISVLKTPAQSLDQIAGLVQKAESLFCQEPDTSDIIDFLAQHVAGFSYVQREKHLDQKM